MKHLFSQAVNPSRLINQLLLQGKNSTQIHMLIHEQFPNYDDRKLRNLISVLKSKYKRS